MIVQVKGNKLVIEVDISPEAVASAPPSKTGKTRLVASTHGLRPVDGHAGLAVSLNVTQSNK